MKNSKRLIIYFSVMQYEEMQAVDPFTISFLCLAVVGLGTSISSTVMNHIEGTKQKDQRVLEDAARILQKIQNTKKEADDKENELLKKIENIKKNIKKEEDQNDITLTQKVINKNIDILETELITLEKELETAQKNRKYTQEDLQNISNVAIDLFLKSELSDIIDTKDFSDYKGWLIKSQKKINTLFDKYNKKTKKFYKNFIIHVINVQSEITPLDQLLGFLNKKTNIVIDTTDEKIPKKPLKLLDQVSELLHIKKPRIKRKLTKEEFYQHIDVCLGKDKLTEEELYYILKYTKKYIEKEDNIVLLQKVLHITNIIYQNSIENIPRIYFMKQFEEKYGFIDDILKNIEFLTLLSFIGKIFDEHKYKHKHDHNKEVERFEQVFFSSYKLLIDQKKLVQIFEEMTIFKHFLKNFQDDENNISTLDKKMIDYIEDDIMNNISEKNMNIYILYKIINNENINENIAILYILHLLKYIEIKKFKIPSQDLGNLNLVTTHTLNTLTKVQVMVH